MEKQQKKDADTSLEYKRLYYRSCHRGCKETDTLFGRFVETELAELTAAERIDYAALLEEADVDIYQWVIGRMQPPEPYASNLIPRLRRCNGLK
jgi:antitoxin CptB